MGVDLSFFQKKMKNFNQAKFQYRIEGASLIFSTFFNRITNKTVDFFDFFAKKHLARRFAFKPQPCVGALQGPGL